MHEYRNFTLQVLTQMGQFVPKSAHTITESQVNVTKHRIVKTPTGKILICFCFVTWVFFILYFIIWRHALRINQKLNSFHEFMNISWIFFFQIYIYIFSKLKFYEKYLIDYSLCELADDSSLVHLSDHVPVRNQNIRAVHVSVNDSLQYQLIFINKKGYI